MQALSPRNGESNSSRSFVRTSRVLHEVLISEEKIDLQNTEKALLNILDDYSSEKYHSEDSQRALLNILEDYSEEKINLENTQRAVLNILEDYSEAKEKAEESTKLKEAFLANMSHEIRTPMNAIIGFSDILSNRKLGVQEKEYVTTIKSAGENLLIIINDILDISKIEAGMMTFEEQTFSVKEIFNSLRIMLMEKAKAKNIELIFSCHADVPDGLLGDPTRLNQIIINLVGNAIKFTQKGSIQVQGQLYKGPLKDSNNLRQDGSIWLEFSVTDTGIGISTDKLHHIFERFRQAESHTTRKYGGTGLGLSIAKQLVELQGGQLQVESVLNEGSVFSFYIPYKKSQEVLTTTEAIGKKYDIEKLSQLHILLVEDNELNVRLISSLFSENNLTVQVAENGRACIEKLKAGNFDLILMDMEMPVMNGYEAAGIIRNELKNLIPIIAMTANAMAGERERCLSMGMNDYISKPINANLLFEKMYSLIPVTDDIKSQEPIVFNLTYLNELLGNKRHLIKEIMDAFVKQVPVELSGIETAILQKDYKTIKSLSHTMKSSASVMGIYKLDMVLQEMETLASGAAGMERIKELNATAGVICAQALKEIEVEGEKFR